MNYMTHDFNIAVAEQDFNNTVLKAERALTTVESALAKTWAEIAEFIEGGGPPDMTSEQEEIHRRYLMVKELSAEALESEADREVVAKKVLALVQKDQYFSEAAISPDHLMTIGCIKRRRNDLDFLQSTAEATRTRTRIGWFLQTHDS